MNSFDIGIVHSGYRLSVKRILIILALTCIGVLQGGIVAAQDLPALFTVVDTVGVLQAPPSDRIGVAVDFSLIHPDQNPVAAVSALIPGQTITLLRERINQRGGEKYTWAGKVEGHAMSTAVLTVEDGFLYGYIDFDGESYSISPDNDGYIVVKNDPAQIPPYNDDTLVSPDRSGMAEIQPLGITPLSDDGSVLDVLVLYTQQFQTKYGGGLNAKIQSFIDLANQGYVNSGISTSLRLAHAELYTNANAAEGISINSALSYIRADSAVEASRDAYHADLISLLRVYQNTSSCGLGYILTPPIDSSFADWAFNVVEVKALSECTGSCTYCSDLTFAHELGHNMGCAHDRAHAGGQGAYPYSYGYDHVAAGISSPQFATIMSYQNPEIIYFSTPLVTYSGVSIGVAGGVSGYDNPTTSADNARSINNTRVTIANFRVASSDTTPPVDGSLTATPANGQVALSWSGFSDSGSGLRSSNTYRIVRSTGSYPSAQCMTGTQIYSGTGTSTTDTGLMNGQTYYYRACAYDNAGNISAGATANATLPVNVTVSTLPSGRQITVGGSTVTAPQTYAWAPGSSHTISTTSPQSGSVGTQYIFSSWSDGGGQSHSISPGADMTYTASFLTQYQLTTSVAPAASGSVSPNCTGACWYNSGTSPNITATPDAGYIFSSWSGNCSGTGLATMVTMNAAKSCTANFVPCASQPTKNATTSNLYPSISSVYNDNINTTDGDTVKVLALDLAESLSFNRQLTIFLTGGFDCSFNNNTSTSMVQGAVSVGNGIVTVTNFIFSPSVAITGNGSVVMDNLVIQ